MSSEIYVGATSDHNVQAFGLEVLWRLDYLVARKARRCSPASLYENVSSGFKRFHIRGDHEGVLDCGGFGHLRVRLCL